jgi:hypothetical protein
MNRYDTNTYTEYIPIPIPNIYTNTNSATMVKRHRRSGGTSSPSLSATDSSSSRSGTTTTTSTTTIHHRLESKRTRSTKHLFSNQLQQLHGMDIDDEDLNILLEFAKTTNRHYVVSLKIGLNRMLPMLLLLQIRIPQITIVIMIANQKSLVQHVQQLLMKKTRRYYVSLKMTRHYVTIVLPWVMLTKKMMLES